MSKQSEDLIVWSQEGDQLQLGARCGECNGAGRVLTSAVEYDDCDACSGIGWFGIDPERPVMAHVGSAAKVAMLTVRYASGVPLWHPGDGFDADLKSRNLEDSHLAPRPTAATETVARRDGNSANQHLASLAP
ncbi:MAG: hypothetical protein HON53_04075 [Planctomycetaceae bacterium]|nr:hypothetical protein [Planctomycetaceae bacterium]MBT6156965.1 hypothetical protein [Planctomycetaceae bacterium]MBT6484466.1 hypothetical protein [Planctomycetaceae bacterium]MBT6494889.1 hypothetical protein [Planctomycetaceae bacterium]